MNGDTVLAYLRENGPLADIPAPDDLATVLLTPRFRASSHVIFLIVDKATARPALVAKLPRLPGDHRRLQHEADILRTVQELCSNRFTEIPRLLAFADIAGYRMLLQSAVQGEAMRPALVRRQPQRCLDTVVQWLIAFHRATARPPEPGRDGNAVLRELETLRQVLPGAEFRELLAETERLTAALAVADLPRVLAHGDLSHPNLLLTEDDQLGVVDWELGDAHALPAMDLFFFLAYVAFARQRARNLDGYVQAFRSAFFAPEAWAAPYVQRYAAALELEPDHLGDLFVLTWARYVAGLLQRLHSESGTPPGAETTAWLQQNRYFALWRYAVENRQELRLLPETASLESTL